VWGEGDELNTNVGSEKINKNVGVSRLFFFAIFETFLALKIGRKCGGVKSKCGGSLKIQKK